MTSKTFRLSDQDDPRQAANVDIAILPNQVGKDGSAAQHPGFVVTVCYSNAPSVSLFNQTYPDQGTAQKVMDDLSLVAGEVEGLLRSEDFEKASEKTKDFLNKCSANSGQSPVAPVSD